ncbi:DUF3237 domain-containing protein [Anaerovorax odorimutans]|uniref:UPF0311 protein NE619_08280 n=1 Tax=Anaerovorax odorimutans TaxID=109327 RepID=A0ABT1RNH4_9FIRM|nr:DUF3237 domain-containing protein [Anaerovorax odorimutans]MCQ4636725.1 DUF3237 domain-containing protein [Anaerovorax odorimutans]
MRLEDYELPTPDFEKLFRAEVLLSDPFPLGEAGGGYREIVAVTGGSFEGAINGEILDFGGDWGLLHSDTINELNTKYLLKTDDGAYISVECSGKLIMDYEDMTGSGDGDNADYYFRQTIRFTAGEKKYSWLNEIVAVAVSVITPDGNVCLDAYKLV